MSNPQIPAEQPDAEETLMQAIQAIDASLSTMVVARNALIAALRRTQTGQAPSSGAAPAPNCADGNHPADQLQDVGVASGALVCGACGNQVD